MVELSDDDDVADAAPQRKRKGADPSRRAQTRAKGSTRVKAYEMPLPPNWAKTDNGLYQLYALPKDRRVYNRICTDHTEENNVRLRLATRLRAHLACFLFRRVDHD